MKISSRAPIGPESVVSVQGRYLVRTDGTRFLMQGIAFPTAPPQKEDDTGYNAEGWIAVLEQLANETDINTIRVYRMDCHKVDYSEFLNRAAELGIYVVIPLTAPRGKGVLDRDKKAPHCYPAKLYRYGKSCIDYFTHYPNVLAGVIGNEVMNSLESWNAAPCIRAYARDLKLHMQTAAPRTLPLLYAAQHDSMTADVSAEDAMAVTLDYLSCNNESSIDIFGINVESWCSSLQTFHYNEDGITESGYYALWKTLHNATIPLVFSEMGCSKILFNRDNGLRRYVRDWAQVPVVLNEMADTFSGFCAYAYDGNPVFRMMNSSQSWDGHNVLDSSADFENFRDQLHAYHAFSTTNFTVKLNHSLTGVSTTCDNALEKLQECYKMKLFPIEKMPSHYRQSSFVRHVIAGFGVIVGFFLANVLYQRFRRPEKSSGSHERAMATVQTTYQSVNTREE